MKHIQTPHLDNSCLPYDSDGFSMFLPTGTKSLTNAIPKTFEGVSIWKWYKCCCVFTLQLPRQRRLVHQRFCFRSSFVEYKHKNTFGQIPFVLHFQCFDATILWTEREYIGNATHMELVQTCFCVFIQRMSSENKTTVGQVFVVLVIAMSKRTSI